MFSNNGRHSKDHLEEVIRLQAVANSISDIKEELMGDVKNNLQGLSSNITRNARRDMQIGEIQTLTDTLQNRSADILSSPTVLEPERSLELTAFPHHAQSDQVDSELPLETINSSDNTLNLDQNHYYDGLNSGPIMVYQMPSGNIVPFDSLVSVPITKTMDDKTNDHVDLLDNSYVSQGVYTNSGHHIQTPLYIMSDMNKYRSQDSEKMLISQIYSTDDTANLFLDPRHSYVRNNKCEINMGETLSTDLNLATNSNNYESAIPISSVTDINQFPLSTTYSSTDTDSEVALTLASLGNLKNDKVQESCPENNRIFENVVFKEVSHSLKDGLNQGSKSQDENMVCQEPQPTLVLRSRKGKSSKKGIDISTEIEHKIENNSRRKSTSKLKAQGTSQKQHTKPIQTKSHCEPRKENLLGQLLKASKHCEPASLIPEGVVDDVIPAVGYRIMDMTNLTEMIRMMHKCSNASCRGLIVIQEQASLREGAVSHLSIICTGCQEGAVCTTSNKIDNHSFDINSRVEQLTKEFNIEESQVQRMLEILGIFYRPCEPPPKQLIEIPKEEPELLKKKKRKVAKVVKEKKLECNVCHRRFSGINHLKSHMYMHDSGLHTCPYCQAYFKRVFNLQEHVKKHKNIKYHCDQCPKSYTDRSTLQAHKKSFHLEQYKIECEVCSKRFFHRAHYAEHMRVHSGEKPFACDICGKRYPYVASVRKHMQSHRTVAKYKCRLCGKWFRLLFALRQHLVQQHKLKKCDIEAQVKTDLMAQTVPIMSPSRKVSTVLKSETSAGNVFPRAQSTVEEEHFNSRRENLNGICSVDVTSVTVTEEVATIETPTGDSQSFIYTNLSDWKKPL